MREGAPVADQHGMFRRNRTETAPAPDPGLMRMVEKTGASARAAESFRGAVGLVLDEVAAVTGWPAAHAWVPSREPGTWESFGLWYPDDGIGLGELRAAVCDAVASAPRGHLALALHMSSTQWVGDLSGHLGSPVYGAAERAGIVAAVACPVFSGGRAIALLEWYLGSSRRLSADVAHVLGHLSGVLSEVYERPEIVTAPVVPLVPQQRALRWPGEVVAAF